jgi:hypothetical protein
MRWCGLSHLVVTAAYAQERTSARCARSVRLGGFSLVTLDRLLAASRPMNLTPGCACLRPASLA